jgi:hypothetical protein
VSEVDLLSSKDLFRLEYSSSTMAASVFFSLWQLVTNIIIRMSNSLMRVVSVAANTLIYAIVRKVEIRKSLISLRSPSRDFYYALRQSSFLYTGAAS